MNPLPYGEHKFPQGDSDFSQVGYLPSHPVPSEYHHYHRTPAIHHHASYHLSSAGEANSYHGEISAAGGVGVSSNGLVDPGSSGERLYGENGEEDKEQSRQSFGGTNPSQHDRSRDNFNDTDSMCHAVSPSSVLSSLSSPTLSMTLPSIAGGGGGGREGGGKQPQQQQQQHNLERGVRGSVTGSSPSSLEDSPLCRPSSVTTMTCLTSYNHQHNHQHHQHHHLQTPHHLLPPHHQRHLQQLSPNSGPGAMSPSAQSPYPGDIPGGPGGSPLGAGDDGSGDGAGGVGGVQPIIYPWMRKSQSGKSVQFSSVP